MTEEQVQKGYVWMNKVNKDIFNTTYEEIAAYFGTEGQFEKEEYSDHMKANYRYYKYNFEDYQDIEERVIDGITFRGRTYKNIGYEWIEYVAQLDDNRALSVGLRDMDCVPGTMTDIILTNMKFQ